MKISKFYLGTFILFFVSALGWVLPEGTHSDNPTGRTRSWITLEPGLEFGNFLSPRKSILGDSLIRVLRIDPQHFHFKLLNASAQRNSQRFSAKTWAEKNGLIATINASMYQADKITSVSLMKTKGHVNNIWFSKDRSVLAFDPKDSKLAPVQILDRDCQDVTKLREKYQTLIQSIRMIACDGRNVWAPSKKMWSTSAIGMDQSGHILFIHVRSPYSTHALIEILKVLPLEIKRAMYVEGGAEAQMYVHSGNRKLEFVGSFSSGSNENDANSIGWPIPNVVGIARKSEPAH